MRFVAMGCVLALLFSGCSITKRHFNKGWYISFHRNHQSSATEEEITVASEDKSSGISFETSNASSPEVAVESIEIDGERDQLPVIESDEITPSVFPKDTLLPSSSSDRVIYFPKMHDFLFEPESGLEHTGFEIVFFILLFFFLFATLFGIGALIILLFEFSLSMSWGMMAFLTLLLGDVLGTLFVYQCCKLFNRKEPIITDERRRNRRYWLIAACVMLIPVILLSIYAAVNKSGILLD